MSKNMSTQDSLEMRASYIQRNKEHVARVLLIPEEGFSGKLPKASLQIDDTINGNPDSQLSIHGYIEGVNSERPYLRLSITYKIPLSTLILTGDTIVRAGNVLHARLIPELPENTAEDIETLRDFERERLLQITVDPYKLRLHARAICSAIYQSSKTVCSYFKPFIGGAPTTDFSVYRDLKRRRNESEEELADRELAVSRKRAKRAELRHISTASLLEEHGGNRTVTEYFLPSKVDDTLLGRIDSLNDEEIDKLVQ